jgi:hypothetical protein
MTDLQTKTTLFNDVQVELPFVVNEFQRVRIPPKNAVVEKEFTKLPTAQKQKLMERLIDHVKEI